SYGGAIIDTPGVRQFQLWDIVPEELAGLFRDIRPFASKCRYPNCSHQHENQGAVKDAIADGRLDARRYDSYSQMLDQPFGGFVEESDEMPLPPPQQISPTTDSDEDDFSEVDFSVDKFSEVESDDGLRNDNRPETGSEDDSEE
ncbi:MAG: hypothetical protein ACK5PZ_16590, partial [Pirellula sp.]